MIETKNETIAINFKNFFELVQNGGKYQIDTPDGWQDIGDVYLKQNKNLYSICVEGKEIIASEDHLFEIDTYSYSDDAEIFDRIEILDGGSYIRAKNLKIEDIVIDNNYDGGVVTFIKNVGIGNTYDLEVLSNEHRYWSNDISSHNTGKTAIIEGLALRITERKCSRVLYDKRIVVLDLAMLVSGTKYRGQFEERVKALMAELEKEPNVILFIDEIHTLIGAGSSTGSLDASNMFKPALSRGQLQIIGATTLTEYRLHIEKDGALERRFQKVLVEPATEEESIQILTNIKENFEKHHSVIFTPEAIKACVELTSRYVMDRFLPDKAIDAMDEVGSFVRISNIDVPKEIVDIETKLQSIKDEKNLIVKQQKFEEAAKLRNFETELTDTLKIARKNWEEEQANNPKIVTDKEVAYVVSMMTGIPVEKIGASENSKLSKMTGHLKNVIIGQDDAVTKIVRAIKRGRLGLADPNKPAFVGIAIGNPGTGKTLLAKEIAKYLFDSEDSLIRLDMSEFSEQVSTSKIVGSSAGYVGYDDGSVFLNKIRNKPYSVILLDEIEKAHPDIFNMFLQVFEDGHMTDSHGRKVSFKNTIILMTSNVGTRDVKDFGTGVGFNTKKKIDSKVEDTKDILEKALKNKFPPEFINRIDEIIYFMDLGDKEIYTIIDLELAKIISRVKKIGYELKIDDTLKQHLVKVGYVPLYGARPMKRAIVRWVDDFLTDFIMDKEPELGMTLVLCYNSETDSTEIKL
jgi:ATP-dependent Clp protease ATP-binding subunit ClpC